MRRVILQTSAIEAAAIEFTKKHGHKLGIQVGVDRNGEVLITQKPSRLREPPPTERLLSKEIKRTLEAKGFTLDETRQYRGGRGRTIARVMAGGDGVLDLIGFCPWGQYLAIEVKQPGQHLRPEQAQWICDHALRSEEAIIIIVKSRADIAPLMFMGDDWHQVHRPHPQLFYSAHWRPLRRKALEAAALILAKQQHKELNPQRTRRATR